MRSKLVRIRIRKLKRLLLKQEESGGAFDSSLTKQDFLFNEKVREVYEALGPFNAPPTRDSATLVDKEAYRLRNGSKYWGQWSQNLKTRTGLGMFVWLDGSLYEGQWRNGRSHGVGRLIHVNGDVYQGEWQFNTANGRGKFSHVDG